MKKVFVQNIDGDLWFCTRDVEIGDIVNSPYGGDWFRIHDILDLQDAKALGYRKRIGKLANYLCETVKEGDTFLESELVCLRISHGIECPECGHPASKADISLEEILNKDHIFGLKDSI